MSFPRYAKYKESGVEWLGDVPEHWDVLPLKNNFKIVGGSTPKSEVEAFWDGDILWATPSDLSKRESVYINDTQRKITADGLASCGTSLVPHASIILSTRAPIGSLAIAEAAMCTNQGCKSLVPAEHSNSVYFAHLLSICTTELNIRGKGTTFLEISGDELGAFRTPTPPLAEQTQIAAFLDRETAKIDALVAEQRRLMELLKEKRQAVISHAVTQGLNPNAPMKPSGIEWLGDVPEHWEVTRIANVFREVAEPGIDELPILSVSIHHGVSDKEIDEEDMDRKVTRSDDRSKYKQVAPDDLVYNMMRAWQGGFGTVTVAGMVSPAYVVARPLKRIETAYIEHLLRTPQAIEQMRRHSRGVTDFRLRLYWDEFKNIQITLPPEDEAKAICVKISEMEKSFGAMTAGCEELITLLQERRTALISAAVTGQIDVRPLTEAQVA
jgi:type I restriction enzyme S subunit